MSSLYLYETTKLKYPNIMDLQIKGNWHQLKGQLKEKYGELTDDDLMMAQGKAEELIGILQEKTGKTYIFF